MGGIRLGREDLESGVLCATAFGGKGGDVMCGDMWLSIESFGESSEGSRSSGFAVSSGGEVVV